MSDLGTRASGVRSYATVSLKCNWPFAESRTLEASVPRKIQSPFLNLRLILQPPETTIRKGINAEKQGVAIPCLREGALYRDLIL